MFGGDLVYVKRPDADLSQTVAPASIELRPWADIERCKTADKTSPSVASRSVAAPNVVSPHVSVTR